jgi:signal transduction histidine kinase
VKGETSALYKIPFKMLLYTMAIGFFVYMAITTFVEGLFEKRVEDRVAALSSTLDWALTPLVDAEDAQGIERLFERIISTTQVDLLRIYDSECVIKYSNLPLEVGEASEKRFIEPIIKRGRIIVRKRNYSNHFYELAIPIKGKYLIRSEIAKNRHILYMRYDLEDEMEFHQYMKFVLLLISSFFLLLLFLLNVTLIKVHILSPLLIMKEGLAKVSEGDYSYKVETGRDREVNELIRVFNKMASKIRESSETLEKNKFEAERLNSLKDIFLANMTHELRTPLNSIMGYTELLLEDERDNFKRKRLSSVVGAGDHLLGIINSILDFSKMDAKKLELATTPFNIENLLKSVEDLFRLKANEKNLDFQIIRIGELPQYLVGDEGRIRQILINLISNAFKFTDSGHIHVRIEYNYRTLKGEVEDTGRGIEREYQEKIFNSFEQVDLNHKGTGLGLSITKALCKLMKGDIEVKSTLGEGTTFSFYLTLPSTEEAVESSPDYEVLDNIMEESSVVPEGPIVGVEHEGKNKGSEFNILVAEDVRDNQLVLEMMLKKSKVNIDFANNGKEALDLFRSGKKYDLFLLDIQMPVMNGFEVLTELRKSGEINIIHVVALTAYALKNETDKIREAGSDDILTKPIDKRKLRTLIEERKKRKRRRE